MCERVPATKPGTSNGGDCQTAQHTLLKAGNSNFWRFVSGTVPSVWKEFLAGGRSALAAAQDVVVTTSVARSNVHPQGGDSPRMNSIP